MGDYLKNNGWSYIGGCGCGGVTQHKYYNPKFPVYKIMLFPGRGTFMILKNNLRFGKDGKADELEQTLKNYGITE